MIYLHFSTIQVLTENTNEFQMPHITWTTTLPTVHQPANCWQPPPFTSDFSFLNCCETNKGPEAFWRVTHWTTKHCEVPSSKCFCKAHEKTSLTENEKQLQVELQREQNHLMLDRPGGLFINLNTAGLKPSLPSVALACHCTQWWHPHLSQQENDCDLLQSYIQIYCNTSLAESSNWDSCKFAEQPASFLPKSKGEKKPNQQVQIRSVFLLCWGKMLQPQKSKHNPFLRAQLWIKMQQPGTHQILATLGKWSKRASERAGKSGRHSASVLTRLHLSGFSTLWVYCMGFGLFISFFPPPNLFNILFLPG